MAIYNGRILMRKGNEADFDPSKLMSGEWAVSLDAGIVRICLEAGKVIRMATYEAFEEDMKQIEAILLECQSIEEAVRRINTEVSEKLNACAEYVQQAKNYSEQAKTSEENAKSYMQSAKTSEENAKVSETNAKASENSAKESENNAKLTEERAREVFESIPEDYSTISNDLYELAIKETASGEEIHVNDSSNLKLREFALYGKAKQNTTQGNQLFEFAKGLNKEKNGIKFNDNGDGTLSIIGLATASEGIFALGNSYTGTNVVLSLKAGTYYVSGLPDGLKFYLYKANTEKADPVYKNANGSFTLNTDTDFVSVSLRWAVDIEFNSPITKIMLNSGTTALPWESFTNGASPNPQYPQPIEVSGASGSVAVKSVGKNLLKNEATSKTVNGITFTVNDDKSVTANGTSSSTASARLTLKSKQFISAGKYYCSGSIGGVGKYQIFCSLYDENKKYYGERYNANGQNLWDIPQDSYVDFVIDVLKDKTVDNVTFYPMLRLSTDTDSTYEPYKETTATIPTENGIVGIKVSSGGNYTDQNGQQWICDEIVKYADGSGELIQRLKSVTFVGKETFWLYDTGIMGSLTSNGDLFADVKKSLNKECRAMSNIRKWVNGNSWVKDSFGFEYGTFWFEDKGNVLFPTVEDWKNYLSETNMHILYELETPIHTPLTAEEIAEIEKLNTFYPVTNISNDFDCGMRVTYYCDSKNYISNQLAIMKQEQEEAMMNMLLLMPTEVQATMIENDTNDLLKESEI